jgi:hypothetical protein
VIIEASGTIVQNLEGQLVAAVYVPNAETKDLAQQYRRVRPIAGHMSGRWPHLLDGIYFGWLKLEPPITGMRMRQLNLNSSKLATDQPVQSGFEFSVPVVLIDEPSPNESIVIKESETHVIGRIICGIAGPNVNMCGGNQANGGYSFTREPGE